MPVIRLYSRMLQKEPWKLISNLERPFVMEEVCDPLEYIDGRIAQRTEIVAQILLEKGVEPGRHYEGQLWLVVDEDDWRRQENLGWFIGGPWSASGLEIKSNIRWNEISALVSRLPQETVQVVVVECCRSVLHLAPNYTDECMDAIRLMDQILRGTPPEIDAFEGVLGDTRVLFEDAFGGEVKSSELETHVIASVLGAMEYFYSNGVSDAEYSIKDAHSAEALGSESVELPSVIRRCLLVPLTNSP